MSKARHQAREKAVQALYQWQMTDQNVSDIERQFLEEQPMKGVDVEYFQELLHKVPATLDQLDEAIAPHVDRPVNQIDQVERAILRVGTYELKFKLEVPYRVVINEGVELAKTFGAEQGHKYVNSILDKVAQNLRSTEVQARQRK